MPLLSSAPLYWWEPGEGDGSKNFGDDLSVVITEKLLGRQVQKAAIDECGKVLAIGSILQFARQGDTVWGSGINGKHPRINEYQADALDVRAVRGPLTRFFLQMTGIEVPEVYGDPASLLPLLFPEFKKPPYPARPYLVIPHMSELHLFPDDPLLASPLEPWDVLVDKILDSALVISSSLHGLIVAEAFGIPARLLRVTNNEPMFKYCDYYYATGRRQFEPAYSVDQAIEMGGEPCPVFDLQPLLSAFPYDRFDSE